MTSFSTNRTFQETVLELCPAVEWSGLGERSSWYSYELFRASDASAYGCSSQQGRTSTAR